PPISPSASRPTVDAIIMACAPGDAVISERPPVATGRPRPYAHGMHALFFLLAIPAAEPVKVVSLDRKDPVSFEKEVEPILAAKCAGCHSGKARRGKYDLGTYPALMKGGKTGPAVVAGKSADSLLVQLAGRTKDPVMPPGKKNVPLTPEELAVVKLWIDQ